MRKTLMAVTLIAVMLTVACASTGGWREETTLSYTTLADVLEEVRISAREMCDEGLISAENCVEIKDIHAKTKEAYILAGDSLSLAIDAEDAVTGKQNFETYKESMSDLSRLVPKLINFARKIGISLKTTEEKQ